MGSGPRWAVLPGIGALSGTLTEEVGRLTGLGAVVAAESRDAFDLARVTMADPEGNEFAVELSEEELHPSG